MTAAIHKNHILTTIAILFLIIAAAATEAFLSHNYNYKWSHSTTSNVFFFALHTQVPRGADNTKTAAQPTRTTDDLPGVNEFEHWFDKVCDNYHSKDKKNDTTKYVRHGMFANGRGLELIVNKDGKNVWTASDRGETPVITVPQEVVLRSVILEDKTSLESLADDWDATLALKLLKECQKGPQSDIYGYCMLLTRGQEFESAFPAPPSTAPHCIRNWTKEQKERLLMSTRGERLVRMQEKQSLEWTGKYEALSPEDKHMFTKEQFFWDMEAVHSRAFKGEFGGEENVLNQLSKALVPFAAAALALNYVQTTPVAGDDTLTGVLLALSCAPVVLNFLSDRIGMKKMDAVLLPFIDSANHLEEAQSKIELDPLKGVFTVSVEGRNCIVEENKGKTIGNSNSNSSNGNNRRTGQKQLYISYGPKGDSELLLNYGFLPQVTSLDVYTVSPADESKHFDEIRQRLADCYNHSRS